VAFSSLTQRRLSYAYKSLTSTSTLLHKFYLISMANFNNIDDTDFYPALPAFDEFGAYLFPSQTPANEEANVFADDWSVGEQPSHMAGLSSNLWPEDNSGKCSCSLREKRHLTRELSRFGGLSHSIRGPYLRLRAAIPPQPILARNGPIPPVLRLRHCEPGWLLRQCDGVGIFGVDFHPQ